jgi:hypothetical protein
MITPGDHTVTLAGSLGSSPRRVPEKSAFAFTHLAIGEMISAAIPDIRRRFAMCHYSQIVSGYDGETTNLADISGPVFTVQTGETLLAVLIASVVWFIGAERLVRTPMALASRMMSAIRQWSAVQLKPTP